MTMNSLVASRAGKLAALAALATVALAACGSDPGTGTAGPSGSSSGSGKGSGLTCPAGKVFCERQRQDPVVAPPDEQGWMLDLVDVLGDVVLQQQEFTYDAGDGEFDFITFKRSLMQKGVRVKAAKPANPDRSRIEAIVLKLLEQKGISLLDAYKLLQLDNAQQLYDNWTKQTTGPGTLARDALDVIDDSEARVAFNDIMAGKTVAAASTNAGVGCPRLPIHDHKPLLPLACAVGQALTVWTEGQGLSDNGIVGLGLLAIHEHKPVLPLA